MTKQFEATQVAKAETKGMSDVQQRKKRRAAYLGEVGKRNDAPLLLGLLLAFLGPAAIILGIAFYTGVWGQVWGWPNYLAGSVFSDASTC